MPSPPPLVNIASQRPSTSAKNTMTSMPHDCTVKLEPIDEPTDLIDIELPLDGVVKNEPRAKTKTHSNPTNTKPHHNEMVTFASVSRPPPLVSLTDLVTKASDTCPPPRSKQEQYDLLEQLKVENKQLEQIYFDSVVKNQTLLSHNVTMNQNYTQAMQENIVLKQENMRLKQSYLEQSQTCMSTSVSELQRLHRTITQKRGTLAGSKRTFDEIRVGLKDLFTEAQISALLELHKGPVQWHDLDVIKARKLYELGPTQYRWIRTDWRYPLPDESHFATSRDN